MRCIITPSDLVFQATNTDDFNRVQDIIESNSTFNDFDYKTLSVVIYPEKMRTQYNKNASRNAN